MSGSIRGVSAQGADRFLGVPYGAPPIKNLRFRPPGSPEIELEGRVIWVNRPRPGRPEGANPGMGVQFVDLTPMQREQILGLVRTFAYLSDEDDFFVGNS